MHACIHVLRITRTHACTHTYIHACMQARLHACMYTCMHAGMHACMNAYIHTYACMHTHTHTHTHTHIHMHKIVRCVSRFVNRKRPPAIQHAMVPVLQIMRIRSFILYVCVYGIRVCIRYTYVYVWICDIRVCTRVDMRYTSMHICMPWCRYSKP